MPKVSVLMPIYKTNEIHLREAIESILNQTYTDFEFLILNDSPEETYLDDIVNSYTDERIVYSKNEKNMGITPSRNKLIDLSKGEYLAVMDHDDISLPLRFEKQVDFLNKHKSYGVVSSNFMRMESNEILKFPKTSNAIKQKLFFECFIMHPASMIRKNILTNNKIKYEENFSPAEDYRLWCTLVKITNFYNIQEVLFHYRNHINNTSNLQNNKMRDSANSIRHYMKKKYPFSCFFARFNRKISLFLNYILNKTT